VHRAGASLNVHTHFHVLCLDGVYVQEALGTLRFYPAPPPQRSDLQALLRDVYARVLKWLGRRGLLGDSGDVHDSRSGGAAETLVEAGMQRGCVVARRTGGNGVEDGEEEEAGTQPGLGKPSPRETDAMAYERFNLHASVVIAAHDDLGRERLCRYLSRPAFALSRLRLLRDGTVCYRVKKAGRGRVKERHMTAVECLSRLAAMVPPPRYPLLRFHGVLAPRHAWRARIVPRPPSRKLRVAEASEASRRAIREAVPSYSGPCARGDGMAAFAPQPSTPSAPNVAAALDAVAQTEPVATEVGPNLLSLAHWTRLLEGELYAPRARLDWQTLLKRTFDHDLRVCPRCGQRMMVRAILTEASQLAAALARVQRSRDPPML
jgi:Putative transposase